MKGLLSNSSDHYLALLSYRTTPLPWCKLSPAELLMERKVRTAIPQTTDQLKPNWPYLSAFRQKDREYKEQQKKQYDQQQRVKDRDPLEIDTPVWVMSESGPVPGQIQASFDHLRSYIVSTPTGLVRRNRQNLNCRTSEDQNLCQLQLLQVKATECKHDRKQEPKSGHLIG